MGILFDFDGVIADTSDRILQHTAEASRHLGFPRHPTREDLHALERMDFDALGRHLGIPEEKIDALVQEILALFREDPLPLPIFEGMHEVLTSLSKRTPLGIVTGNSHGTVARFLHENGLANTVQVILGLELSLAKDQKILLAARELGEPPSGLCFVGDAKSDILAARKAGAKSVAVAWGSQPAHKLRTACPDHLVFTPRELLSLLGCC
jgi:phosphoglycolate phosphatase